MVRLASVSWAIVVLAFTVSTSGSLQTPQRPVPAPMELSTRTDIVLADVTVLDGKGQQVIDLSQSDFTLSVNGRPRAIQAVQYVSSSTSRAFASTAANAAPTDVEAGRGRYLLIVIDEPHLGFGSGRAVLRSAENLLDRLAPEDRVGLLRIPTGIGVEFTRDHARVLQSLRGAIGSATTGSRGGVTVYPSEALDAEQRGQSEWPAALIRECRSISNELCVRAMELEAIRLLQEMRSETSQTLRALDQLLRNLRAVGAPVNLVLISEGLFIDRGESLTGLASAAASARVSLNIVSPVRNWYDVTVAVPSSNTVKDDALAREGLEQLAGQLRGGYYRAVGDGTIAFDRISAELAGYYLLAFEPTEEDRTGRERRIRVEVKRRGVTVRSRPTFVVPSASALTTRATEPANSGGDPRGAPVAESAPASTPAAPVNAVPVRLGTYSLFNADDPRVRVLIAAEVGEAVTEPSSWRASLMLKNQSGEIVSNSAATVSLSPTRATEPSPLLFSTEIALAPGDYSLTLALVGSAGRVAMAEHKLAARFQPAPGGFNVSDLVVAGEPIAGEAMRLAPSAIVDRDRAAIFLEVQHDDAKLLADARATFEVAQAENGPAIVTTEATSESRANGTQRAFAGALSVRALPPGDYVLRATLTGPGGTRSQTVRVFRIDRGTPAAPGGARGTTVGPPLMRGTAAVPAFALQQAVAPGVVRSFVDELEKRHPSSPALRSFLAGLAELQANRLTQAEAHFRQTLRSAPDFVGVAFFLGACHAASGRDREAIGAWQMSLLSKGADAVYPAIVDAMLRVGESKKALELLEEAPQAWPDPGARMRREAIARATIGEDEAAAALLVKLLDGPVQDSELLFLGVQIMYRLYNSRGLNEADRTRFGNWARQYEALGGPESALVRAWRDHVGK